MPEFTTNGTLITIIRDASEDVNNAHFADARRYYKFFRAMEETFFEKVHSQTDIGLAISEMKLAKDDAPNVFTIHGCRHICDLICSLDKLVASIFPADRSLTPLEAYILLCAAHVHDAGNVRKREGHPQSCVEVISKYKELFADTVCRASIYDVASAHGGNHPTFGRDTFRAIQSSKSVPPRLLLLAALIRLGDELSENESRVPENVAEAHKVSSISQLAYAYAKCFTKFELRDESLFIVYNIYSDARSLSVTIDEEKKHFLDFLEHKIDTIEREARYCSQYGRPSLSVGEIHVLINSRAGGDPSPVIDELKFILNLNHGYVSEMKSLCERSMELKERHVTRLAECFPGQGKQRLATL